MNSSRQRIVHVPRRFAAEEWGGTETVILEISRQQQAAGDFALFWRPTSRFLDFVPQHFFPVPLRNESVILLTP